MQCPKCQGDMEPIAVTDLEGRRCAECGGLWLEPLMRERLMDQGLESAAKVDVGDAAIGTALDEHTQINCPNCAGRMIHMVDVEQSHVGFESCSVCGGVYLDAGELRDLSQATLAERLRGWWQRNTKS